MRAGLLLFVIIGGSIAASLASAAEPAPPASGAAKAAAVKGPGSAETLPDLPHSSISLPWSELRGLLLAGEGRSGEAPPIAYLFSEAKYAVAVEKQHAVVTLTCEVTTLVDHWTLVPFGPADSGLVRATSGGEALPMITRDHTLQALFSKSGKHPVSLTLEREIEYSNGRQELKLPLMSSPMVMVQISLPGDAWNVHAAGAIAAQSSVKDKTTLFSSTYAGGATAVVSWEPRPKAAPAKISADTATLISIENSRLVCHADIRYEIVNAGVDTFRVALPDDVDLTSVAGDGIRRHDVATADKRRVLEVELKEPVKGVYRLALDYFRRLKDADAAAAAPLVSNLGVESETGNIGIAVSGTFEVQPKVEGASRIDVKELPDRLWQAAQAPLLFGYEYRAASVKLSLALTRHKDVNVLVAMSDVCEAATTVTPDGKCVTKLMYVVRNNLKQFMTLDLPAHAELWSALVDDRPVTPSRNAKGQILIPLKKSAEVDADDNDSYRARREQRRRRGQDAMTKVERLKKLKDAVEPAGDLKPYDVEIVFVGPKLKLDSRGELAAELPQCDIPVGHLAWAVLLPSDLHVVDVDGNTKQVGAFSLPFRHFADVAIDQREAKADQIEKAQAALQELAKSAEMANQAKAEGVLPVRIEIPLTGKIQRFEKFLVVDEAPAVKLTYRKHAD